MADFPDPLDQPDPTDDDLDLAEDEQEDPLASDWFQPSDHLVMAALVRAEEIAEAVALGVDGISIDGAPGWHISVFPPCDVSDRYAVVWWIFVRGWLNCDVLAAANLFRQRLGDALIDLDPMIERIIVGVGVVDVTAPQPAASTARVPWTKDEMLSFDDDGEPVKAVLVADHAVEAVARRAADAHRRPDVAVVALNGDVIVLTSDAEGLERHRIDIERIRRAVQQHFRFVPEVHILAL